MITKKSWEVFVNTTPQKFESGVFQ